MDSLAAVILIFVISLTGVRCTSVPEQCQDIPCEIGFVCAVREAGPCTPRFCPPPFPECIPISSKPGVCPNRLDNLACLTLRGAPMCLVDVDCTDDKKCCDGCCKNPDADQNQVGLTGTPGMCPVEENIDSLRLWTGLYCPDTSSVDECLLDDECPVAFKCCTGLCGNKCKRALSVSLSGRGSRK